MFKVITSAACNPYPEDKSAARRALAILALACLPTGAWAVPATEVFDDETIATVSDNTLTAGDWTFGFIKDAVTSNLGFFSININGVSNLSTATADRYLIALGDVNEVNGLAISSNNGNFKLNSLVLAKGVAGATGVVVQGVLANTVVATEAVTLNSTIPGENTGSTVTPTGSEWNNLDTIRIVNSDSTTYDFDVEIDDISVSAVPLPPAQIALTTSPVAAAEGDTGTTTFSFTASRSVTTSTAVSTTYTVSGSGATPADSADFGGAFPTGTVNFAAGVNTAAINVSVSGDTAFEPDEGFTVTLSAPSAGAVLGTSSGGSTITNDDTQASLAISPTSATNAEGDAATSAFTFTVTRSNDLSGASSASYAVTGSGANPADATDFGGVLPSGTVDFAATETSKVITVDVSGDTVFEPDEAFTVTLSAPTDATLGTATATGTITNDDTLPGLSVVALSANKAEGDSGTTAFTFNVTRSGDAARGIDTNGVSIVNYSVAGTGANPADATDFGGTLPSGTVNLASGETSKTVTLSVTGDTNVEPDETFTVTLSAPTGATLGTATATGTITNDDTVAPGARPIPTLVPWMLMVLIVAIGVVGSRRQGTRG